MNKELEKAARDYALKNWNHYEGCATISFQKGAKWQLEQKQVPTDEEIEKLAENVPEELGWTNDGTAEANDIKKAFIKGFKSALQKEFFI